MGVVVIGVGVGCPPVFMTSLLGSPVLGVSRCARCLMSFLSCFVWVVLVVGVLVLVSVVLVGVFSTRQVTC